MPGTLFMRYWSRDCILLAQLTPFVKSLNFIKICTLRIIKSVPSFILVILCLSKFLSRLFTNILCHKTKNTVKTGIFTCWATWNRPNFKRNSKIPKEQTEIVKSRTDKTMANKMKRKTNIVHTTLHWKLKLE